MLFSVSSARIYTHSYGQLFMHMYGVEGSRTYAHTCRHTHTHTNLFRLPGPRTLLNLQRALELVHSDGSMHCGVIFCTHECECMCMRVCVDGKHSHTHPHTEVGVTILAISSSLMESGVVESAGLNGVGG